MNLFEVSLKVEGVRVPERNEDNPMMGECGHAIESSGLLPASQACSRDKHASILSSEFTGSPKLTSGIPEGLCVHSKTTLRERFGYGGRKETNLPLGGEVSVTGGDTEEEGVVVGEIIRSSDGEV